MCCGTFIIIILPLMSFKNHGDFLVSYLLTLIPFFIVNGILTGKKSKIGLHPHKGFEICSFVLKGNINHYDNKIDDWITLDEGDVQIIRSGSGISHAEEIDENSEIFQIWFIPDLSVSLYENASYNDYKLFIQSLYIS